MINDVQTALQTHRQLKRNRFGNDAILREPISVSRLFLYECEL